MPTTLIARIAGVASFFLPLLLPAQCSIWYSPVTNYAAGTNPCGLASVDFNNDVFPDIAPANRSSSNVSILLNNGNDGWNHCDSIYGQPDTLPQYPGGLEGFGRDFRNKVFPILSRHFDETGELVTSIWFKLIIDAQGTLVAADFFQRAPSENCQKKILAELQSWEGWKPANAEGRPVCGFFEWGLSCILWKK